ncbi:hypothetical protein PAMP_003325 [Pampus punctatissimus]
MMEVQDGPELCFPELLNNSCMTPMYSWSKAHFVKTVLSFIIVFTVALNLLVIISISHFRQLHTPTNLLLLSLAVSDLLVGVVMMPGILVTQTTCWLISDIMCLISNFVAFVINASSVSTMMLISFDRYMAICEPLHYTSKITVRKIKICVCLCWLYSVLFAIFNVKNDLTQLGRYDPCQGQCPSVTDYITGVVDIVLAFIAPVTFITIVYMRVFVVAVSQARAMRSHVKSVTLQVSVTVTSRVNIKKSELKAARTLGITVIVFIICLFPYHIASLTGSNAVSTSFEFFVLYLLYFNSCLNPLIYALFYPWFRKAIKLILTLKTLQPGSCEVNIL